MLEYANQRKNFFTKYSYLIVRCFLSQMAVIGQKQTGNTRYQFYPRHQTIGSFRNDDGDGNENVKKAIGSLSKTISLHAHHAFLYIS